MFEISGIKFKSQAGARKFINLLLAERGSDRIAPGDSVFNFLAGLLTRHPDHHAITPKAFHIQRSHFGNLELAYESQDALTVFSYNTCVRGKSGGRDLDKALRGAVMSQVMGVTSTGICELCGDAITADHKTHVDHELPFVDLKQKFMESWTEGVPSAFDYDAARGGFIAFKPEDAEFRSAWVKFHLENSVLRVVHDMCNLKRPRKITLLKDRV